MKAEELMIGDWVTVVADDKLFPEQYVGKTIPCKVQGFDIKPIIQPSLAETAKGIDLRPQCGMMVRVVNNFDFMYFVQERLSPIPLTAEILGKNGFNQNGIPEDMQPVEERDYYDETYVWSEIVDDYKENEVSVYLEYGKECVEIHCIKGSMDIECKYVHQLQHALKVCGIDKNIVL